MPKPAKAIKPPKRMDSLAFERMDSKMDTAMGAKENSPRDRAMDKKAQRTKRSGKR